MKLTDDIEFVDMTEGNVVMADGTILPITDWFDDDGEDCEPSEAVMIVAGNDDYGWIDVAVSGPETVH